MENHVLLQIIGSFAAVAILALFLKLYSTLVATPRRLQRMLKQQGFGGPPPAHFLLGNIMEIKKPPQTSTTAEAAPADPHNFGPQLYSVFRKWRRQYGDIYTFLLGNTPVVVVDNYDVVRELTTSTSMDLGRPLYLAKDFEALLGKGISAANGKLWAYERKVMAPGMFIHKVKGMKNSVQQSALMLIDLWKGLIEAEGGKADIKIDDHLKKFAGDAISKVCFGSNYAEGEQIFQKITGLQLAIAKKGFFLGIPGMSYIPTKHNRKMWELRKDIKGLILKLLKDKNEVDTEKNMMKIILEGAKGSNILSPNEIEDFIVDNCKTILLAGYEPTSIAASWCLMLLASNQEWQQRAREEVIRVCNGRVPDMDSIDQMKQLTMVINESLRLYPAGHIVSRYALNDVGLSKIRIPKGVIVWIMATTLHTDPDIWGSDSYEFKPERFGNGIAGACKLPHLFMPFGFGPRMCLGHNLAMVELKILLAHVLSNFSFSLSPNYVHAPAINVHLEPGKGVHLVMESLDHSSTDH
ncbi:cytochrome P450 714C2-like [Salvia miltiorrhiza]|uniref:cytochrome P450 714C2-like n=1 Tax=Salvia miltiorrhiza TaxID=226208 RepID=UPI0025AD3E90|nr:cytochrome P450 714C2-like [Salvia miltiorrhiza]